MMHTLRYNKRIGIVFILILFNIKYCSAQFGGTQSFNGSTQSIVGPAGMMNGSTVFTIEFWVQTTENRSNGTYWQRPTLIGTASSGAPSGDFGITTDNGFIGMWSGLNNGGDNYFLSGTVQINDNARHHIAAVNNGTTISLYTDGMFTGSISSGLGLITNAAPLTIGSSSLDFSFPNNVGLCNFFHQSVIDEVRFSNNIRYTANFTVPGAAFTADVNTVALYHLDGCVNGLVPDASANGNNASPKNLTGNCTFVLPPVPALPANNNPANINKAEYFYDADPGFGSGINIPVISSTDISGTYAVNTTGLPNGAHRLYVRTKDANARWSLTNTQPFFIVPPSPVIPGNTAPAQITKAEYFYDTDPGFGNGTNIPISSSFDVSGTYPINLTGLTDGVHRVYLRTKDAAKNWSITNVATFYITPPIPVIGPNRTPVNIVKAEYFLDTDPGFGNGTNIAVSAATDITLSNAFINLTGLPDGVHHVYLRTKDINGSWSITNNSVFSIIAASVTIPPNPAAGNITKFEYFFDHDPGFGNATAITVAPTTDLANFMFTADISALNDSTHTLYIRSYDGWSLTTTRTFLKGSPVPLNWLSFTAKAQTDSVLLNWQTGNGINNDHFDIERSKDGRSFTSIGQTPAANNGASSGSYHFTDLSPLPGISYYRIKQTDLDGAFKYSVILAIRFGKDEQITVYPNPANDVVNLLFDKPQAGNASATLISINGQVIQKISVSGVQFAKMNVAALASGIYELRIISNEQTLTKRIAIQH